MYPMDPEHLMQVHEQMLSEEMDRLAGASSQSAGRRWSSALAWELKRGAERIFKILNTPKNVG
jgi:hypothetical protein